MLDITKTVEGSKATFALSGRLDTTAASELRQSVEESLDGIADIVFDFEKLDYISSAGLRVLLSARKALRGIGTVKLVHVSAIIMDILEMSGFSEILTIEQAPSENDAPNQK